MPSKNVELFPEVLATLTFLPLGVYMGFITHFYFVNDIAARTLYFTEQWPHLVSSVCAIITGLLFVLRRPNRLTSRYRFEHFYMLMFGMFFVMLGGIILASAELPYAGIYIIFAGKGVCYIAALSYLNIRMAKSRYRMLRLALPHWVYLFGVAIGATTTNISTDQPYSVLIHYNDVIQLASILIIIMAVVLISGYLIVELLYRQKKLDYKQSLDSDINRENGQAQIFLNKYFLITQPRSEAQLEHLINTNIELDGAKEISFIILAIVGKIGAVVYFYTPFMFIYLLGVIVSDFSTSIFVITWYGMIGITASLVLLCWGPYKLHYLISCGLKVLALSISLSVLVLDEYYESVKIVMTILYIVFAFGYGYCDINILSFANLRYNEIILALGYSAQYITIGVLQYYTLFLSTYIFNFSSNFNLIFPHMISYIVFFAFLALVVIFMLPNRTQLSLLEIKNTLNKKPNVGQPAPFPVVHPNNGLPPPYVVQPAYPYHNVQPGSHLAVPQGLQGVPPGTNYPQYYPAQQAYAQQAYAQQAYAQQAYAQQQMQPNYYQPPPIQAYDNTPVQPGMPPPNYYAAPTEIPVHNNKITEL